MATGTFLLFNYPLTAIYFVVRHIRKIFNYLQPVKAVFTLFCLVVGSANLFSQCTTTYGSGEEKICSKQLPYNVYGKVLDSGGVYEYTLTNTGGCDSIYSFKLKVQNTWTGVVSTAWENPNNWSCHILPDIKSDIFIDSGTVILNSNTSIRSLAVNPSASLTINSGIVLNVAGTNFSTDSTFTDPRDGHTYRFRHIGSQVWMTQNLNYVVDTNSCYNNNPANCAIYGRLYSWNDASISAAPPGWHLPSNDEWTTLTTYLGGDEVAGGAMKEAGSIHWLSQNIGATNSSGFTALPGGSRVDNGPFIGIGSDGKWWSTTEEGDPYAFIRFLIYGDARVYGGFTNKVNELSVRCIRNY